MSDVDVDLDVDVRAELGQLTAGLLQHLEYLQASGTSLVEAAGLAEVNAAPVEEPAMAAVAGPEPAPGTMAMQPPWCCTPSRVARSGRVI